MIILLQHINIINLHDITAAHYYCQCLIIFLPFITLLLCIQIPQSLFFPVCNGEIHHKLRKT